MREIGTRERSAAQQGIVRRADEEYLLDHECLVGKVIVRPRSGQDRDIDVAAQQAIRHLLGEAFAELELHAREVLGEMLGERCVEEVGEARRRAQPHRAARLAIFELHLDTDVVDHTQQPASTIEQDAARFGDRHAARAAFQQGPAELVLQELDVPAQRRLRDIERAGGGAEPATLGDGDEIAKLAQVHGLISDRDQNHIKHILVR